MGSCQARGSFLVAGRVPGARLAAKGWPDRVLARTVSKPDESDETDAVRVLKRPAHCQTLPDQKR